MNITEFKAANTHKRTWLDAVSQECELKGNEALVLEAIAYCTDPETGIGEPCIGTIMEEVAKIKRSRISYNAVRDNIKRLVRKGALRSCHRGNQQSNQFELPGYKYKLESLSPKSSYNPSIYINNNTNNTYYSEYESYATEKEKTKTSPPPSLPSRKASLPALNGAQPDEEVRRVAKASDLPTQQTTYAINRMRNREGMTCPARFLATMVKGLKAGTWNMDDVKPEPKPKLSDAERKRIEAEVQAKAEAAARQRLADQGHTEPPLNEYGAWLEFNSQLIAMTAGIAKSIRYERAEA